MDGKFLYKHHTLTTENCFIACNTSGMAPFLAKMFWLPKMLVRAPPKEAGIAESNTFVARHQDRDGAAAVLLNGGDIFFSTIAAIITSAD